MDEEFFIFGQWTSLAIETLPSISPSTNTTIRRWKNGCIRKEKQKKATAEPPFMV